MAANERDRRKILELEAPSVTCGACQFTSALKGTWTVEDGRLVWRGDPDPQPGRGPDLGGCCEGSNCGRFSFLLADWGSHLFSSEELETLRRTAEQAREDEMRAWREKTRP